MLKPRLQAELTNILMGIQRVPTLLLLNPCQDLTSLHLEDYTVLDCEPLHDIKSHFGNLFKELPHILPPELRSSCKEVIEANMKDNMTGAAYRLMSIELFVHAKNANADHSILLLLETALRISELIYSTDEKRTPRRVLQLYNCTWLHHELCSELFSSFHGDLNRNKFFGSYLHSLVVHAPIQLEIISLRSVNTENQERYFNQARRAATNASNRQAQNVISTTLLRLQAKAEYKPIFDSVEQGESTVAKAGLAVTKYSGTYIASKYIQPRTRSWQAHLQRISRFL